ncbi:MAG: macro domain-containing protein [Promethearchaeota archaeon]
MMKEEKSNQFIFSENPNKSKLTLIQGDITNQIVDVLVNAANEQLILGTGVAGAIRRKGGLGIQEECNRIGYTPVGRIAITSAGNIKQVKYIFHAVGPQFHIYSPKKADELLRSTITQSSNKLVELNLTSIAFPAISTGIFGFPKERAAKVILSELIKFLKNSTKFLDVRVCLFSDDDYTIFNSIFQKIC